MIVVIAGLMSLECRGTPSLRLTVRTRAMTWRTSLDSTPRHNLFHQAADNKPTVRLYDALQPAAALTSPRLSNQTYLYVKK